MGAPGELPPFATTGPCYQFYPEVSFVQRFEQLAVERVDLVRQVAEQGALIRELEQKVQKFRELDERYPRVPVSLYGGEMPVLYDGTGQRWIWNGFGWTKKELED